MWSSPREAIRGQPRVSRAGHITRKASLWWLLVPLPQLTSLGSCGHMHATGTYRLEPLMGVFVVQDLFGDGALVSSCDGHSSLQPGKTSGLHCTWGSLHGTFRPK